MRNSTFLILIFTIASFSSVSGQVFKSVPQKWQRDIEVVKTELPKRHPDLFKNISKKNWDKELDELSLSLVGKSDLEIALALQEIIAKVGDPHTSLNATPLLQLEPVIPVGFGWYGNALFCNASVKKFEQLFGAKILKINDLSPKEALERLARYVPKNNEIGYLNSAMQLLRFPIVNKKVGISGTDTLLISGEDLKGKKFQMKIFPVDVHNDKAGMIPRVPQRDAPDLRFRPIRSAWTEEWHEADSLLVFQYSRCQSRDMALANGDSVTAMQSPEFQPVMDSIFNFMKKRPNHRLLIDLRFNPGGGAGDGLKMAQRLAQTPELNQKGRVFVATNAYTMSAAIQVAVFFKQETEAILIGEPTGDSPNHFGEMRTILLPNSELTLKHSTKFMRIYRKGNPDTLEPDIHIPLKINEFLEGKDPVLAFIKKYDSKK